MNYDPPQIFCPLILIRFFPYHFHVQIGKTKWHTEKQTIPNFIRPRRLTSHDGAYSNQLDINSGNPSVITIRAEQITPLWATMMTYNHPGQVGAYCSSSGFSLRWEHRLEQDYMIDWKRVLAAKYISAFSAFTLGLEHTVEARERTSQNTLRGWK